MKFCTNCGAKLEEGAKFCTSCGQPVEQMAAESVVEKIEPQQVETFVPEKDTTDEQTEKASETENQEQAAKSSQIVIDKDAINDGVAKTKNYAQNYWNWIQQSLKTPFDIREKAHNYYGITTFAILSLILSAMLVLPFHTIIGKMNGVIGSKIVDPFGFAGFIKYAIFFFVLYAVYVGISYSCIKYFSTSGQLDFFEFTNRFAHRLNYTVFTLGAAFLIEAVMINSIIDNGPNKFILYTIGLLLTISSIGFSIGFFSLFLDQEVELKIDRIFVAILAYVILLIVLYIIADNFIIPSIEGTIRTISGSAMDNVGSSIDSALESLFSNN